MLFASSSHLTSALFLWSLCPCLFLSILSLGGRGGGLVYSYGDDDLNRTEGVDDKGSGDEDSRESNSVSIGVLNF